MKSLEASIKPQVRYPGAALAEMFDTFKIRSTQAYFQVKFFGYSHTMDDYEQRKLKIFNQINFFQAVAGFIIPLFGIILPGNIPPSAWYWACWPAGVSILVLGLNFLRKYQASLLTYFFLYPLCTCFVYLNGMNSGIDLYFILFVILSVFFLQDIGFMLFAIGFSMISFFVISVTMKYFIYEVEKESPVIYLLNKIVSLVFIFYGLFLIKRENTIYQFNILTKQNNLTDKNSEIEKQKEEIGNKATLLEQQKKQLSDLNAFKNKLFSIISHDLPHKCLSPDLVHILQQIFQNR